MTVTESEPVLPEVSDIEAAERRIRDRVPATPAWYAYDLSELLGQPLWLKAENLQPTGSFKARGALNWLRTASQVELDAGLATVSAGNHAMALAWAAAQAGVEVTVVMPAGSSSLKVELAREYGANVIVHGAITEAVGLCRQLCREQGLTLVHPYDDPRVMAGQGTLGLELLRQCPEAARVLCPVGGGGLISGLGIALKASRPDIQLVGVEPTGAATMGNAWRHDDASAALSTVSTIATSLAPAVVGRYTFAASRRVVDELVTVSDAAIVEATLRLLTQGRLYVEPGAAVGLAALLEGAVPENDKPTVLVITGGNADMAELCALRPGLR